MSSDMPQPLAATSQVESQGPHTKVRNRSTQEEMPETGGMVQIPVDEAPSSSPDHEGIYPHDDEKSDRGRNSPAVEESLEARLERLGRQRPEVFGSIWAEIGFVFSISMAQVLTVGKSCAFF